MMISKEILDKLAPITEEEKAILNGKDLDKNLYTDRKSSIISNKKLLTDGKIIAIRPHTRFVHFPKHKHDYVEVVYMCSGSTTHMVNGNKIELQSGELLFMSQNACQEIYESDENDIAVNFIILPQFFDMSLAMLGEEKTPIREFIAECLSGNPIGAGYLHFKVADVLPIQNIVENLLYTLISSTKSKRQINQTTMGLLFLLLCDYTDKLCYATGKDAAVLEVVRYIEENYKDGTLEEISTRLHFDFCWLSREIKKATGKSFTELIQEKRLSQASFFLKNTSMNIHEIANAVGYENVSYFHRLFFKKFKLSPKKYRDCK